MYYVVETEVLPPATTVKEVETKVKVEEKPSETKTSSNCEPVTNVESAHTTETENLKTISPMTFSTKASTFEKDPLQRMKSYHERKNKLLEVARAHYIEKNGLKK